MAAKVDSPYLGLIPYSEEDARFFFGRERDQRRVVASLFASRLTLLYGASGVGKSSLLRAGVVNELRQRIAAARAQGERPDVAVIYFNEWQVEPLAAFRAAVGGAMGDLLSPDILQECLARPTLSDLLTALVTALDGDLFVIFDQFEEFFLYHARKGTPGAFERDFAGIATRAGSPVSFVLSLRDDALSKLDHFQALIPNLFANRLAVKHLSPDEARQAIVRPIEAYNALPESERASPGTFTAEPGLVSQVINDVRTGRVALGDVGRGQVAGGEAGVETPYLQLVMTELWRRECSERSNVLRRSTLAALGGAEAIVRNHLNTTIAALSDSDRDICASLFQYLVTPSGTKIAYTAEDLAQLAKRPAPEIELVLDRLSGSRMRILSPVAPPTEQPGPIRYEIYHDSLAHAVLEWRRRYVDERDATERERQQREEAARQEAELERVRAIAEAQRARAESEAQRVAEQRRAARRFKYLAAGAVLLAAIATWAGWQARRSSDEARRSRDEARQAQVLAERYQKEFQDLSNKQQQLVKQLAQKNLGDQERQKLITEAAGYQTQLARLNQQSQQTPPAKPPDVRGPALQRDLDTAQKRITDLEASLQQANQTITTLTQERDAARKDVQDLRDRLGRAQNEIEKLKADLAHQPPGGGTPQDPRVEAEARVRQVLSRYRDAYNVASPDRTVQQIRSVYPQYPQSTQLLTRLKDFSSYGLTLDIVRVNVNADLTEATVLAKQVLRYTLVGGNAEQVPRDVEFTLRKAGDDWVIVSTKTAGG